MISKFPELINREDAKDAKKREGGSQCDRIAGRFRSASLTGRIRGFAATKEISPQRHEDSHGQEQTAICHFSLVICHLYCSLRRAGALSESADDLESPRHVRIHRLELEGQAQLALAVLEVPGAAVDKAQVLVQVGARAAVGAELESLL